VTPRTAGGIGMGRLVLEPMHVESPCRAAGNEAVLGWFGPPDEPPVIALVGADAQQAGDGLAEVTLQWRSERQAPLNYYLSLRVLDAGGAQVASRDLPPLLGGYPTSLWCPGRLISDRVLVPLPADAPPAEALTLEVVLYDRITLSAVGTARVPPD